MLIGGNAHPAYATTVYGTNPTGVQDAIDPARPGSLGFVLLRIGNDPAGCRAWKQHFGDRVKIVGVAGNSTIAAQMLPWVDFLEGPNEYYTNPNNGTQAQRASKLKTLWTGIAAARDAYTARFVPLLSPSASLGNVTDALHTAQLIGALSPQPEYQSIHCYPGNRTPDQYKTVLRQNAMAIADILAPSKPRICTEMGTWWDDDPAVRNAATHHPTAPSDAVNWWPLYLQVLSDLGFYATLVYQSADEAGNDAYGRKPLQEGRLGLLDLDLSDKPWTDVVRQIAWNWNGLNPPPTPQPQPLVASPWVVPSSPSLGDEVKALQNAIGVTADGMIGTNTWEAIKALPGRLAIAAQTNAAVTAQLDDANGKISAGITALGA